MHGHGMFGDLVHMGIYLLTIVAWMYLWLICVFNSGISLRRRLGTHALLICALGVPSLATMLVGGALLLFGIEYVIWSLMFVGVGLPVAGAQMVKHDWHGQAHP